MQTSAFVLMQYYAHPQTDGDGLFGVDLKEIGNQLSGPSRLLRQAHRHITFELST